MAAGDGMAFGEAAEEVGRECSWSEAGAAGALNNLELQITDGREICASATRRARAVRNLVEAERDAILFITE